MNSGNEYFGEPYNGKTENQTVIVYPEYYSTWDAPETLVPFAEKLRWAATNDRGLYNDLGTVGCTNKLSLHIESE